MLTHTEIKSHHDVISRAIAGGSNMYNKKKNEFCYLKYNTEIERKYGNRTDSTVIMLQKP